MKSKYLSTLFFLLLVTPSFAQVGIGTTNPDDSSALDVTAPNKGLLLPRVALSGTTDTTTIASPTVSLMVYNTATAGTSPNMIRPGYYYYTGTQWERLNTSGANTVGPFTTATPNGATIADGVLQLAPASSTTGGIVNTGAQTFAGTKTFNTDAFINGVKVGRGAGNVTTNTAFGSDALNWNTSGTNNTANGNGTLNSNNSGTNNTAVGDWALSQKIGCNDNSAFGAGALGSSNGFFGFNSGHENSGFGTYALTANSGSGNVSAGNESGGFEYTGSYNTMLGTLAILSGDIAASNSSSIGYYSKITESNTIQLGNDEVTDIYGGNSSGYSGTGAIFHGKSFVANSDVRIKKDIVNSKYGLATILKLRPVDYYLINDVKQEPQVGFIAQEVKAVVPELVIGKEGDLDKGEILGVNYAGLTPVLTKAIQEQQKEIETLDAEMETSKDERKALKIIVEKLINKKQTPNQNEK